MYIVAVKSYDDKTSEEPQKTFEEFESYDRALAYAKTMKTTHDRPDIMIAKPIRIEEGRRKRE